MFIFFSELGSLPIIAIVIDECFLKCEIPYSLIIIKVSVN
jgi:hypothetical protein